jgi:PAS domain S-box-containing protein
MTLSVEKKITFGVVLTLAVLLINAFLSYQATHILIDNDQRVRHTYRVINELELTLSTVKDAETGERGYIITGLDEYLTPYYSAVAQIDKHIHTLTELTADNPTQRARIPALQSKIRDRVESLRLGIEYRRSGDVEDAHQLIVSGDGKRMMDDLRKFINAMEVDENALLDQRTEESRKSQRNAILTFIVANLVACTVLLGTWAIIINGINARRRAEEDVRQQRRQLQVTLSSIADAVISCDTQGNVTFLNPIAESLTGWTQQEACGQPLTKVFDVINEQTGRTVDNPAGRAIREGAIVGSANHTVLRTKQGTEVPIDDSASPIKTPGGILLGAVLVFRDITERRRSEEAAARSHDERLKLLAAAEIAREKAEEASRSKDEFLAVLSHELRTPLTAVFGWTQLLQNRDVNEEMRAKAMDVIDRNVRAQIQLIDDLLNVSQIIAGKLQIRREVIDPLEIVKRAIETARPSAEAKDIALHLESLSRAPLISADQQSFFRRSSIGSVRPMHRQRVLMAVWALGWL